jgi:hypothetical protein
MSRNYPGEEKNMSQMEPVISTRSVCEAYSIALNEISPDYDGQWQGITVASDGNCYFGSSTHSYRHGAGFFRFDPRTSEFTILADDLTTVCGEDLTKTPSQGKIHSPIVEHNGWLYFTSHLSNYWKEAIDRYTGAHVLGIELATGRFRDFGIVRPRYSIYSFINVDPVREALYVFSVPFADEDKENGDCRVYRIDIPSGRMQALGEPVSKGTNASFWSYVDLDGNCWFSIWSAQGNFPSGGHGNLFRVAANSGRIECLEDVLPEARLWPEGKRRSEKEQAHRSWTWAYPLPARDRCLFAMGMWGSDDERLWIFDPSKSISSGAAFQPVGFVGPVFLALALGKDRVFYVQRGNLVSHRDYLGEGKRDEDPDVVGKSEDYHLKSISLALHDYGQVTDHGAIRDQMGRAPRHIDSLAADQRGRVFMVGSWHILPDDQPTLQINLDNPKEFQTMKRGQFFACCDVSQDID